MAHTWVALTSRVTGGNPRNVQRYEGIFSRDGITSDIRNVVRLDEAACCSRVFSNGGHLTGATITNRPHPFSLGEAFGLVEAFLWASNILSRERRIGESYSEDPDGHMGHDSSRLACSWCTISTDTLLSRARIR